MRILHACLSCWYVDGMGYQENELVRSHVALGHEVLVVASTEQIGHNGELTYCDPGKYFGTDGALVVRLPYRKWLPAAIARKLRSYPGVSRIVRDFKPDVVLFHGLCGWELLTFSRYASQHPETIVSADSHEDQHNSGRTWPSRAILHGRYYGPIVRLAVGSLDRILCVTPETIDFVATMYKVPRDRLELFPLGGHVLAERDYSNLRESTRRHLGIADDETLMVQAGKMDNSKRVLESLDAFRQVKDAKARFVLAGSLAPEVRELAMTRISEDDRCSFRGWMSPDELDALLCAADIYAQPGTQSATMQRAICSRCAMIVDETPSHHELINRNGWRIAEMSRLAEVYQTAFTDRPRLVEMANESLLVAQQLLDYDMLANRVLRRASSG